ncbi:MAG: phosphoribosylamine--glycine ligase [Oscillospiraceae bacterium]|nr:phosphoribosylamine--glycine ligase [Oscillospiraceae bacterium]
MEVLLIGSGGREHAICWSLAKSPRVTKLYCAPGNGGISSIAQLVDIPATDLNNMVNFALENKIDFVVVAPDDPLALGMVDAMEAAGVKAFGPSKDAAKLESSKIYSKSIMSKYNIPTAAYNVFTDMEEAKAYIRDNGAPIVVKADGLALGKGVVVADDVQTAIDAVDMMMGDKKFGDSGSRIVVEEFLTGPEVTVLVFTDGKSVRPMPSSQDYKRAYTGDLGLNTGGMGAISPSPNYTEEIANIAMESIIMPTIKAMENEGVPFKGVLYFGLMLTENGPKVIEYNARFGDPEAQAVLPLLETDLLDIFEAITEQRLGEIEINWRKACSSCVVMASGGYPNAYETGYEIFGLDDIPEEIIAFHAGTKLVGDKYLTNGGRILAITAIADSLQLASQKAYQGVSCVDFENAHFRTDIGELANNG